MATTSPPTPAAGGPPAGGAAPAGRRPSRGGLTRWLGVGALVVVVLAILYLLFGGKGGADYHLIFAEADQLVRGDQVQVGGVPVGSVTDISLRKDFKAEVTIHVDSSLTPLHEGTTAQVRVPSLSSVANRYVLLSPGPNSNAKLSGGATLPASATKEVTDLDALFNTLNPKTRKGLSEFIQGTAEQYVGAGPALAKDVEYFPPFLGATSHFFGELVRDQGTFTHFLVETARAVTTIAGRQEQLSDLIENSNKTFQAIGSEQTQFAQGLKALPVALRQGNHTFAELPSTFGRLKELVDASKPTSQPLVTLFSHLRELVTTATPTVHNLHLAFSRPGANNDLTDLVRGLPALVKTLESSTPASVTALQESVPITAFFGPYSPDLTAGLRTFGGGGAYYDANGHYARVIPVLPDFKLGENDTLEPASSAQAFQSLKTRQLRRCPGSATQPSADGSAPFADEGQLTCDPSETP